VPNKYGLLKGRSLNGVWLLKKFGCNLVTEDVEVKFPVAWRQATRRSMQEVQELQDWRERGGRTGRHLAGVAKCTVLPVSFSSANYCIIRNS
jgi:hypothetical protein